MAGPTKPLALLASAGILCSHVHLQRGRARRTCSPWVEAAFERGRNARGCLEREANSNFRGAGAEFFSECSAQLAARVHRPGTRPAAPGGWDAVGTERSRHRTWPSLNATRPRRVGSGLSRAPRFCRGRARNVTRSGSQAAAQRRPFIVHHAADVETVRVEPLANDTTVRLRLKAPWRGGPHDVIARIPEGEIYAASSGAQDATIRPSAPDGPAGPRRTQSRRPWCW